MNHFSPTVLNLVRKSFFDNIQSIDETLLGENESSRSSHWRCSLEKSVLKKFPQALNFIEKRLQHIFFPVKCSCESF